MTKSCAVCGKSFDAQRPTAKYCGGTCRTRASRAGGPPAVAPSPVVVRIVDDMLGSPLPLVAAAERELAAAGRMDTMLGQATLELARRISSPMESGASVASLMKQLRETMADALKGAAIAADPLDELRALRDAKRAG